jgi:hypothetical protein
MVVVILFRTGPPAAPVRDTIRSTSVGRIEVGRPRRVYVSAVLQQLSSRCPGTLCLDALEDPSILTVLAERSDLAAFPLHAGKGMSITHQ